jgi:replication-associated recombination protein RarA
MAMVADQLVKIVQREEDTAELREEGLAPEGKRPLHMMMVGPQGTGKTTVANSLAAIYKDMGVLPTDKMVAVHASEISGRFRGEAADNMMAAYKSAKGGVLFVDEAHQLADDKYGKQALRALIKPMADPDADTVVIFAGYDAKSLYKVAPGLESRIADTVRFKPLSGEAMTEFGDLVLTGKMKKKFANDAAYDAMGDALEVIAAQPGHASMRDAEKFLRFADDARVARIAGMKKKPPVKARVQLTEQDFHIGLNTFKNSSEAA